MGGQDTMQRLRAIRKLARQMPLESAEKRLGQIAEVASGKGDVKGVFTVNLGDNLIERVEAAHASRSPMVGDKPEPEKERKEKPGRDRMKRGGTMRTGALTGGSDDA